MEVVTDVMRLGDWEGSSGSSSSDTPVDTCVSSKYDVRTAVVCVYTRYYIYGFESEVHHGTIYRQFRYICVIHPHHTPYTIQATASSNWKLQTKGSQTTLNICLIALIQRIDKVVVKFVGVHFC